jgi:hypothetical protein
MPWWKPFEAELLPQKTEPVSEIGVVGANGDLLRLIDAIEAGRRIGRGAFVRPDPYCFAEMDITQKLMNQFGNEFGLSGKYTPRI